MLERAFWGLWSIVCDKCGRQFELDGTWDYTPSKENTVAVARSRGWQVGKRGCFCKTCRPTRKGGGG